MLDDELLVEVVLVAVTELEVVVRLVAELVLLADLVDVEVDVYDLVVEL